MTSIENYRRKITNVPMLNYYEHLPKEKRQTVSLAPKSSARMRKNVTIHRVIQIYFLWMLTICAIKILCENFQHRNSFRRRKKERRAKLNLINQQKINLFHAKSIICDVSSYFIIIVTFMIKFLGRKTSLMWFIHKKCVYHKKRFIRCGKI